MRGEGHCHCGVQWDKRLGGTREAGESRSARPRVPCHRPLADSAVIVGDEHCPGIRVDGHRRDLASLLYPESGQVRAGQVGAAQISVVEVRVPHRGPGKVAAVEVSADQAHPVEIEATEVCVRYRLADEVAQGQGVAAERARYLISAGRQGDFC